MKIGVIGAGHLGKIHIKCLQQIPDWELLGFFDKDERTRDAVSGELDVRAFDSAEALMDACDAVDIVTNTPAHYELASAALARGCHVFVEKPVTATPEEGRALALGNDPGWSEVLAPLDTRSRSGEINSEAATARRQAASKAGGIIVKFISRFNRQTTKTAHILDRPCRSDPT